MKFGIFTHAEHFSINGELYAYGPYVKEMNIWIDNFDNIFVLAPKRPNSVKNIDLPYKHENISFQSLPAIHLGKDGVLSSIKKSFEVFKKCLDNMSSCDHIHIRCPGNIGLIALLASIFYPDKPKTIKYAGNWNPFSDQPLSYRFQKWLLNNKWLIGNKKVLIYGEWPAQPEHIISFFTASFSEGDKLKIKKYIDKDLNFIYSGALVPGKNPLLAVQIIHQLLKEGHAITFNIYGEGSERKKLEKYIKQNNLSEHIFIHGNQPQSVLISAYKNSHFCILPSRSEGWPKAIAEGMFFGCVPIATEISCIPWMLDEGKRGILMNENPVNAAKKIGEVINSPKNYNEISQNAMRWSRKYTLEKFEQAIKEIL